MDTISFVDILFYLKKHIKTLVIFVLVGALLGYVIAQMTQTYTASVGVQYNYSGAEQQLNPLGGKLDVYEVMKPVLIHEALNQVESDLSVEEVRNGLSVSPVVKTNDSEAQAARLALGESVDITTTYYNVSFTSPKKEDSKFTQMFLYELMRQYDDYFCREYLSMVRLPDFMSNVDVGSMDYMEKCDYIEQQLNNIIAQLDRLVNRDSEYTSKATGLDFSALRSLYTNLRENEYKRLYADVRVGLLSTNRELLIQGYKKRIEEMLLNSKNNQDESARAHGLMLEFYDQYKKSNLYYQAQKQQGVVDNGGTNDNKNMVYDYDLALMINTYDDILTRYVDTGVASTNLQHEMEHNQQLINEFSADTISIADKADLIAAADTLIEEIRKASAKYANLAERTLDGYYGKMISNYLKYTMAVEVTSGVSVGLYVLIGFLLMLLVGAAVVILYEVISVQIVEKKMENVQDDATGALPANVVSSMTPIEQAFYEQAIAGFTEMEIYYQPMVCEGRWVISELLVRWKNKRFGQVTPNEFIAIAEKYKLMSHLGEWVMRKACLQSIEWQKSGLMSPRVSVNFSTQQIESQSFTDSICSILTEMKIEPGNIYLEISGGGELRSVEQTAKKFVALKALGLQLTIDRFGESISSMRVLYDLPADMVKLDRRFVEALKDPSSKNMNFLNQIINVCNERGLQLCACGVEETWEVEKLEKIGVKYQQGFFYSSPLPLKAYEKRHMSSLYSSADVDLWDSDSVEEEELGESGDTDNDSGNK